MAHTGRHDGVSYAQWTLEGDWTPEEIAKIETLFKQRMTPHSSYPWTVIKSDNAFKAKRDYWDVYAMKGETLADLIACITNYYENYEGI